MSVAMFVHVGTTSPLVASVLLVTQPCMAHGYWHPGDSKESKDMASLAAQGPMLQA